jgi:hypothetical protein
MSKVTLRALKQHLGPRSRDELIGDIADLFTRLDAVKDYYALRLNGPSEELVAAYKARIKREFFPARGFGAARLSVARKAVTDYKRLSPPPASLADLMLFYVEQGVAYTSTYGDINEPFYRSMESMYQQAVHLITASDLRDELEERCQQIVTDSWNIGWGFHDTLSDLYEEYFVSARASTEPC